MVEGKPGRPKVLVRRHVLEIKEETQEWLEEMMNKYLAGVAIRAVGEAAEGFLSNPAGALILGGGIVAGLAAIVGADKIAVIIDMFKDLQGVFDAPTSGARQTAGNDLIESMRALIRAFSPLGPLTPLP